MSECICPKPLAVLAAQNDQAVVVNLNGNGSQFHDSMFSQNRDRRIRYNLFVNGTVVDVSPWSPLDDRLDYAGAKHTPSVSTGISLNFTNAYADIVNFLTAKGIRFINDPILQVAIQIKNADGVESDLSNSIVLNPATTDCCEGGYKLNINGVLGCWVQQGGDCIVAQTPILVPN